MVGAIRTWDILSHPIVTIRCFGWRVFWRALFAGRRRTFLSLFCRDAPGSDRTPGLPSPLDRCIKLELQAKRIYLALARTFAETKSAAHFFTDLGEQEQDHADLLVMCWATVHHGGWRAEHFAPWQEHLPALEQQMQAIESSLDSIDRLDKALRLVIEIESSQINPVLQAAVAASESTFVERLRPFQDAIATHISYIVLRLSKLAPELTTAFNGLSQEFPELR